MIYIALYCYKALYLTGLLYLLFLAMCIAGYVGWRKSLALRTANGQPEAAL